MAAGPANPGVFIAYAPRGIGLRCALVYLSDGRDAYGWFTGPLDDLSPGSLYFLLEDFYSQAGTRYVAARGLDLHTGWILDERRCHELAALQEAFVAEWLFYPDDPGARKELAAYQDAELAIGEVNIRFERLGKLSKLQPNWTFYSPEFERPVLQYLVKRWPLEFRPERGG